MISVKAKINQEKIQNKINKVIQESEISESRIKLVLNEETLELDILYDDNILLDEMNLINYIDVELGWC